MSLFKFIKPYKKEALTAPLLKMAEALLELFVPLVVAGIIDNGIPAGDKKYVLLGCLTLGGFALGGLLLAVTAQYFSAKAAVGFSSSLREALFCHITSLGRPETDRAGAPTLITRLTGDVDKVQSGVNLSLRLLLRSPFVVIGAVIAAVLNDAPTGGIIALSLPFSAVVVFIIMPLTVRRQKKSREALDIVLSGTRGAVSGARMIRAFGAEKSEFAKFSKSSENLRKTRQSVSDAAAFMTPVAQLIINAAVIVLFYSGALRINAGSMTAGQVVAQYNYSAQILVELIKLADLLINISAAKVSAGRIKGIFDLKPSLTEPGTDPGFDKNSPAVSFENVSFGYTPGISAVSDISFSCEKGSWTGIIGVTGSGKSTLASLISRSYDAEKGSVRIYGADVKSITGKTLRQTVSLALQTPAVFEGTVRDNILRGSPEADEAEYRRALYASCADEIISKKARGDGYEITGGGANLSGGQKQRISLARALIAPGEILVLDDTLSALDNLTADRVLERIKESYPERCVIIISQRPRALRLCGGILVTDDGRIAESGSHSSLYALGGIYKRICDACDSAPVGNEGGRTQ